jgi:predicted TIM-barrel fold metal-dependent hydrolase
MIIWDLHCHPSGFAGQNHTANMADVIRLADRMGIERLCVYLGSLRHADPKPDEMREHNDYILRCVHDFSDRVFGFAYVNPNYVEASLAEIERCIAQGPLVGVKLWVARRCSDPAIDPMIARAAALKAVIYQHTWHKTTGNFPGESTPADMAALATRHPGVGLICGHTGGTWEVGIRTVRPHRNVSVDLAGSDPTAGFTEMAVRELGPERVIWGSDSGGRSLGSQLAKVLEANLPEAAKQQILAGNLKRMMTPILQAKGIKLA